MSYGAALAFVAKTRADDATDVIRILCAMATVAALSDTRRDVTR